MKVRALVIDDSRVMRIMVMQLLRRTHLAEFEFVEAEDGADALAKFKPEETDIAFVDWNMPTMTGIDFVRAVRARSNTEHIPLVMVTSEKTMDKIDDALIAAGANAYICKPFTAEQLEIKLKGVMDAIAQWRQKTTAATKEEKPKGLLGKFFG